MATLFVVATPIGNLSDMSPRAIEVLKQVQLIAAEDTRVTQKLCNYFEIDTHLTSYHEHNERSKASYLVEKMLTENIDIAITTDAGTPCISDPGSYIVKEAIKNNIPVLSIAGPSAMIAAISVSGFVASEFGFVGFLPRNKKEIKEKLIDIAKRMPIAILHESPHRVIQLMEIIAEVLPSTKVSASCDLTKKHELTLHGNVNNVLEDMQNNPKTNKGEYCIVLEFNKQDLPIEVPKIEASLEAKLLDALLISQDMKTAMAMLVSNGERKNAVYTASLKLKELISKL